MISVIVSIESNPLSVFKKKKKKKKKKYYNKSQAATL